MRRLVAMTGRMMTALGGSVGLGVSCTGEEDIVLERYYVHATPIAAIGTGSISADSFRSHLPLDVGSLLAREAASVAPVRRGPVATDILLRGLGRDNVAVMLDGAPAFAANGSPGVSCEFAARRQRHGGRGPL